MLGETRVNGAAFILLCFVVKNAIMFGFDVSDHILGWPEFLDLFAGFWAIVGIMLLKGGYKNDSGATGTEGS